MLESYIKYFTLIICGFYMYIKLLKLNRTAEYKLFDLIFALLISWGICYVWIKCQPLTVPILIAFSLIYITLTTKTEIGLSITTTIISFGISLASYSISSFMFAIILNFIGVAYSDSGNGIMIFICISLTQQILCCIPFKFRRLKSGMPFLRKNGGGNIGVIISTVLLFCFIIISNVNEPDSMFFILPATLVFMCGVYILLWWRSRLQKLYIERLRADEIQRLQDAIQKKDEQIKNLEKHNDYLAKIIHKDNKLIPSMELAVSEYLQSFVPGNDTDARLKGKMLLKQLKEISYERTGIISEYQSANVNLPSTGVFQIDALMNYMLNKARENGIKYGFSVFGSVKYMTENIISAADLRTLMADLIENAIIATKSCDNREILVSIGVIKGNYTIDIFDSGVPFEPETLINFGQKKYTTHADSGGSGIGLMTVSEILKTYGASFIIDEFVEKGIFTKKVSVKFDKLNKYIVNGKSDKDIHNTSAESNFPVSA